MHNKHILLVDDNPDDVKLTLRALKKNNILNEVVVAGDGAEALEYLFGTGKYAGRDLSDMPQVTLLDLKMPRVDGLEVLQRIRENEMIRNRFSSRAKKNLRNRKNYPGITLATPFPLPSQDLAKKLAILMHYIARF